MTTRALNIQWGQDRSQLDPKCGFTGPRDFLTAVQRAPVGIDDRLKPLMVAGSDEQSGVSDPHGGFLVPEALMEGALGVGLENDPIQPLPIPMEVPNVAVPARVDKDHSSTVTGGLTVTRRPETVAATPSRGEFERVYLNAKNLFGFTWATHELVDSPSTFVAILAAGFADEFRGKLYDERLHGSGVGEFEGVLHSPALITIAKEGGQAADSILRENIDNMSARCWGYDRAIWLAHHTTRPQLKKLYLPIGTGGSAVQYLTIDATGQERLDGRPIYFSEFCKPLGDLGDLVVANWNEYIEGTYKPLQMASSVHARFVEEEVGFKFWMRNDARGWWRSALSPKYGTTTLSPFVTLEAR